MKIATTVFLTFFVYYTSAFSLNYGGTYSLKHILSSILSTSKETFSEGRDLNNVVLEDASLTTVSANFIMFISSLCFSDSGLVTHSTLLAECCAVVFP